MSEKLRTATLYKIDDTSQVITPTDEQAFTLRELQSLVGGYIQYIDLPEGMVMVINEEGKLIGMPRNEAATEIANLAFGDWIAGPAVVGVAKVFGQEPRAPFTLNEFEQLIGSADFVIVVGYDEEEGEDSQ